MNINLSNSSDLPIYGQIAAQIEAMIISGQLSSGDALPSMRVLARELRISVITTKRAYEELERQGYIVSIGGKGSFVADKNPELIKEVRLREIDEHLHAAVELARPCGISADELAELVRLLYE